MEAYTVQIDNVALATDPLTQIYPDWVSVGVNPGTAGQIRKPTDGILHEITVYPDDAQGGILQVWDLAGSFQAGSNDVSTDNQITNAYLTAQLARTSPRAKLIWEQEFKADPGLTTKKFTQRINIKFGLAVRWITAGVTSGTKTAKLNIASEGLYHKVRSPV